MARGEGCSNHIIVYKGQPCTIYPLKVMQSRSFPSPGGSFLAANSRSSMCATTDFVNNLRAQPRPCAQSSAALGACATTSAIVYKSVVAQMITAKTDPIGEGEDLMDVDCITFKG